jgi:hypothetical protein
MVIRHVIGALLMPKQLLMTNSIRTASLSSAIKSTGSRDDLSAQSKQRNSFAFWIRSVKRMLDVTHPNVGVNVFA